MLSSFFSHFIHQEFMHYRYVDYIKRINRLNRLHKRHKRSSNGYNDRENSSKGVKTYEFYESKRTKSRKKPKHGDMTTTVYSSSKTITANNKDPKHRERIATYQQRQPHDLVRVTDPSEASEASELDDLANDQYFYDQLEKSKPSTESSADVDHVYEKRRHPNHEVVFYHGASSGRRGKQRKKSANIQIANIGTRDRDIFGDYGEMVMPDRDVEMHDTYEKNTKESHVHVPGHYSNNKKLRSKKRRRPICINPNPLIHTYGSSLHDTPHDHKPLINLENISHQQTQHQNLKHHQNIIVHQPDRNQHFERIMVTKKLSSADQLHAEIDKIFETKNKNYDKRGHDKAHWELRIVPQRYDEHEEEEEAS